MSINQSLVRFGIVRYGITNKIQQEPNYDKDFSK